MSFTGRETPKSEESQPQPAGLSPSEDRAVRTDHRPEMNGGNWDSVFDRWLRNVVEDIERHPEKYPKRPPISPHDDDGEGTNFGHRFVPGTSGLWTMRTEEEERLIHESAPEPLEHKVCEVRGCRKDAQWNAGQGAWVFSADHDHSTENTEPQEATGRMSPRPPSLDVDPVVEPEEVAGSQAGRS